MTGEKAGPAHQSIDWQAAATQLNATKTKRVDWADLVERIKAGDPEGMSDFYRLSNRAMRYYLCWRLGPQDLDDRVHDNFLIVVNAVRRGDLRKSEALMSFVKTVTRRYVAQQIKQNIQDRRNKCASEEAVYSVPDRKSNPEHDVQRLQTRQLVTEILDKLPPNKSEILRRFYLDEQSAEEIKSDMRLTDIQFRLLKSRAKAQFGELGKTRLRPSPLRSPDIPHLLKTFPGGLDAVVPVTQPTVRKGSFVTHDFLPRKSDP